MKTFWAVLTMTVALASPAHAGPILVNPGLGSLELVTNPSGDADLSRVDGLTFDAFGNLYAALEVVGNGGVSYIDKDSGDVTRLVSNISGVDQIDFSRFGAKPNGALHITIEHSNLQFQGRIYRVEVDYDANNIPVDAIVANIVTDLALSNLEGLVTISESSSAYGDSGDLLVSEDLFNGRILRVAPGKSDTGSVQPLVDGTAALQRPEGMAIGDFAGATAEGLYVAETADDNILHIAADGSVSVFSIPSPTALNHPDNLEFGPDGFLYVSEDPTSGTGRILRYDQFGNDQLIATGFREPAGLAFDPYSGDLFISEQGRARVWRLSFAPPTGVPVPASTWLLVPGLLLLPRFRQRRGP